MKWKLAYLLGCLLAVLLTACGNGVTPPATPQADSARDSRPVVPSRVPPDSIPKVCDCTLRFDHLSIDQGLSQSSVYATLQDSRGFMWFGTEDGLNRYDGYSFKVYKPDPDQPDSLSDRWITAIVEDQEGYLWIGTRQGGLNRFDPKLGSFTHYLHNDDNPSSLIDNHIDMLYLDHKDQLWVATAYGLDLFDRSQNNFKHFFSNADSADKNNAIKITAMYQDRYGRYWVGTGGNGLKKFDIQLGTVQTYITSLDNPGSISSNYITAITEDSQAKLWIGTRNGINRYDPITGLFDRFVHSDIIPSTTVTRDRSIEDGSLQGKDQNKSLSSNLVTDLHFDISGNLWIATSAGLNRYDSTKGFIHYNNDPSYPKSLSSDQVVSLYEDRSHTLWIGTRGGGVNIYDPRRDLFAYFRNDPQDPTSISGNMINPIFVDSEGYAWIGVAGKGLDRFDWSTKRFTHFQMDPQNPNSLGSNDIYSIAEDRDGILWLGTMNGLDRFDRVTSTFIHYQHEPANPDSLIANTVFNVIVDKQNNVWVGTSAGLDRLDRTTEKFIHYIHNSADPTSIGSGSISTMYADRDGNIWVGTWDNGLNRLNYRTGAFTHYEYNQQDKTSLNNNSVTAIYQDQQGQIWIGTDGGGLNLYHPETNSFSFYLEKDGLANGVIYGILEDDHGNLWISTNAGISRFNLQTEVFRNFDVGNGLQSNEFNSYAYAKGRNGELYFGGINGLTVFQPAEINDDPYVPQVSLISLTQNDQPVAGTSSVETLQAITLQYPKNLFEFNFAGLSYDQPEKNQYAYFLEGFDTNWHYIGTKREGRYTNLPGGQYTLLLKAANSDGVWNETPTRISVTVIPPFWQTNVFRVLLGFFAIVTVVGGVGLRTRSIQDRNRALEHTVQERTRELENRNREMEALYKADERILRNVSLNQVYQTLVDVAVDMLHADRSVVFAWDEKQTKVLPRVSHGYAPATLKVMEFAKGEGNVGEVLATGKPIVIKSLDPATMRPDVRAAILAEGIRSFMHLPIVVDHKVIAVFNVAFTGPDFISDDTVRLFSALVNRAAISIANMELFEQTKDLAVMEERNRLARDLHDSAKQKAFAALAQLGAARGILNGNGHLVSPHLNEAENLVSDVIQELTFLVQEIYPIALQEKGLTTTLREYIFEWENRNDAHVNFTVRQERRLPLDIEQAIYRVTQEALANVARHSQARHVDLSLVYNEDSIQLCVSDDGQGFNTTARPYGMGLRSIRDRVGSLRGTAQIQSAPGQGTRVLVQVPTKS